MPALSSFALCSLGDIAVLTRSDSNHATVTPLGTGLPAVFISHGKNGYGAFRPDGGRVTGSNDGNGDGVPDQNADEAANANGTSTLTPTSGYTYLSYAYFSRNPTPGTTGCNDTAGTAFCEFDDIVAMIAAPTLIARMISAGRLP